MIIHFFMRQEASNIPYSFGFKKPPTGRLSIERDSGARVSALCGGSGGFWSKLGKGTLIYVPAGAAVGLVVVLSGYAWWVAIPASGGVMAAIIVAYKLLRQRV